MILLLVVSGLVLYALVAGLVYRFLYSFFAEDVWPIVWAWPIGLPLCLLVYVLARAFNFAAGEP